MSASSDDIPSSGSMTSPQMGTNFVRIHSNPRCSFNLSKSWKGQKVHRIYNGLEFKGSITRLNMIQFSEPSSWWGTTALKCQMVGYVGITLLTLYTQSRVWIITFNTEHVQNTPQVHF